MRRISLGIDTSNYKTSVAAVDAERNIICDLQQYLNVKKGERGLRQSVALFQHVNNLPKLLEEAFSLLRSKTGGNFEIDCISVSDKPRPIAGSYMPCFQAGLSAARSLSAAMDIPCRTFSHQEGHIEAVRYDSPLRQTSKFLAFHFSGGTSEALFTEENDCGDLQISIVGGSLDIAFGQVLDRVGVALGMDFPCGREMDDIARKTPCVMKKENFLPAIKCKDGQINLSGIETSCRRLLGQVETDRLIHMLFVRLAEAISDMIKQLSDLYGTKDILFAGGVSASSFIRNYLENSLKGFRICFGDPARSTDNAVGTALLGGKKQWRLNR